MTYHAGGGAYNVDISSQKGGVKALDHAIVGGVLKAIGAPCR